MKKGIIPLTETKRITNECYEQLHANELDNLDKMCKCLERNKLPKLSQEKIKNLNRPITRDLTDNQIISHKDQMISMVNFTKCLKNNEYFFLINSSKNRREGNSSLLIVRLVLLWSKEKKSEYIWKLIILIK